MKELASSLKLTSRELAKAMEISTGTLYDLYKREEVGIKYVQKFSIASEIPMSELDESFKKENDIKPSEFQKLKQENEELKEKNLKLEKQNSFLSKEVQGIRKELSDMKDRFIAFQEMAFQEIALYKKKMNDVELGKDKMYSKGKFEAKKTKMSNNLVTNLNTSILAEC